MTKSFDAASKSLIEEFPADWVALAGVAVAGPVAVIDANLATVIAEADKVIRVGGATPWLAHFELQTARDRRMGARLFRYNALLDERHNLPTRSVVVLLRPEADSPELTGDYRRNLPGGPEYLAFRYGVLRVWEQPVEALLAGGLGTLPLAPVANLGPMPVAAVIEAIQERIEAAPTELAGLLWTTTSLLMGLRYPLETIEVLLRGARQMKESVVYQAIFAEGEARGKAHGEAAGEARGLLQGQEQEARRLLVRQAERRYGPAAAPDRAAVEAITTLDRLEALIDLVIDAPATSWIEFWTLAGSAGLLV